MEMRHAPLVMEVNDEENDGIDGIGYNAEEMTIDEAIARLEEIANAQKNLPLEIVLLRMVLFAMRDLTEPHGGWHKSARY